MGAIGHWAYQAKKEEEEKINVVLFVIWFKVKKQLTREGMCIA
jgi:hypothetical protein